MLSNKVLIILVLSIVDNSLGYPGGAPQKACESMTPEHGSDPQSSKSPYEISLKQLTVRNGENLIIQLESPIKRSFKGFLVIVKKVGEPEQAYGSFSSNENVKTLNCFHGNNNAATHSNRDDKSSVMLTWIAPENEDGDFEILYVRNR